MLTNRATQKNAQLPMPSHWMPETEWTLAAKRGYLQRTDQQFHWANAGFANFEGFLEALAARKRKFIRRA